MTRAHAACLAVLLALVAACGGGEGGGGSNGTSAPQAPAGAGLRSTSAIHSTETGFTYNYEVYLPPGYATGTARYPVVYTGDAEHRFGVLGDALDLQRREVILVSVWHMGAPRRWIDYTMPGARAYYRFLTRELVPAIDALYRTDATKRIYSGHSLGGQLAMYALYLEEPGRRYFSGIISGDGSLWVGPGEDWSPPLDGEPAATMEREMFARERDLAASLVLAGTTQGNWSRVAPVYDRLAARGSAGLRLKLVPYTQSHLGMDPISVVEGLGFILEGR